MNGDVLASRRATRFSQDLPARGRGHPRTVHVSFVHSLNSRLINTEVYAWFTWFFTCRTRWWREAPLKQCRELWRWRCKCVFFFGGGGGGRMDETLACGRGVRLCCRDSGNTAGMSTLTPPHPVHWSIHWSIHWSFGHFIRPLTPPLLSLHSSPTVSKAPLTHQ